MRRSVKYSSACTSSMTTTLPSAGATMASSRIVNCLLGTRKKRNDEKQKAKCKHKNNPDQQWHFKTDEVK